MRGLDGALLVPDPGIIWTQISPDRHPDELSRNSFSSVVKLPQLTWDSSSLDLT